MSVLHWERWAGHDASSTSVQCFLWAVWTWGLGVPKNNYCLSGSLQFVVLLSYNLLSHGCGWHDLPLICGIQKAGEGTSNCSSMAEYCQRWRKMLLGRETGSDEGLDIWVRHTAIDGGGLFLPKSLPFASSHLWEQALRAAAQPRTPQIFFFFCFLLFIVFTKSPYSAGPNVSERWRLVTLKARAVCWQNAAISCFLPLKPTGAGAGLSLGHMAGNTA